MPRLLNAERDEAAADQAESIMRNTGFAFAVRLLSAAFTAVLTLFLVRALDPAGYGLFGLAGAIGGLLLLPADFGVTQSTARFVAERRRDHAAAAGVIATALRIKLAVTGGATAVLFASAGLIASAYDQPGLAWVVRGMAIAVLAESVMLMLTYAFVAMARTSLTLVAGIVESSVETGASIALVLLGGGAAGAAFGRAIGYLAGAVCALVLMIRLFGRSVIRRPPPGERSTGQILRYGGALLIVDSAYTLFSAIDVLVIGAFLSAASVGLFSAPIQLLAFFQLPAAAISSGVSPRMADGFASDRDTAVFARALCYIGVFQIALIPPLLLWDGPIIRLLLGTNYHHSAIVLQTLTPFAFLLGYGLMLSVTATFLGQARRRIPIAIISVAINVVADLILIPRVGVVGGAIGTDLAYLVYVPAHFWVCQQVLGTPLRPILGSLARASLAAVAMAGVLLAFGTEGISVYEFVLGGSLALLAYAGSLIALGYPGRSHRQTLFGI